MLWLESFVFLLAILGQVAMPASGQVQPCPEGYVYLSNYCVPMATSCPKNFELHNGLCQPIPLKSAVTPCPYGQTFVNGICSTTLTTVCQLANCQILTCCSGLTNALIIPCAIPYPAMSSTPSPVPCPSLPLSPRPWPTQSPETLLPGSSYPGNTTPRSSMPQESSSGSSPPGGFMPETSTSGAFLSSTSQSPTSLPGTSSTESLFPEISSTETSIQDTSTSRASPPEITYPGSSSPVTLYPESSTTEISTSETLYSTPLYPGFSTTEIPSPETLFPTPLYPESSTTEIPSPETLSPTPLYPKTSPSETPNSGITIATTFRPITESSTIITMPPSEDKTIPPPGELRLPCASGTYDINGECHPIYCKNGIYVDGKCIHVMCPIGTIWTGVRCSRPQQSEITFKWSSTIKEQPSNKSDIIVENINNLKVDAPIKLQMSSPCDDDYTDCESEEQDSEEPIPEELNTKCCLLMGPRICRCSESGDKWNCYSKRYRRCGAICLAATVVLKPPAKPQQPKNTTDIVVLPPELDFNDCQLTQTCQDVNNYYDCSGCAMGIRARCSSYCYAYRCSSRNCAYYDQQAYCELYPGEVGCQPEDGCYANWCGYE